MFPDMIASCFLLNVVQSVAVRIPAFVDDAVSTRISMLGPTVVASPFTTRRAGVKLTTLPGDSLFCLLVNVAQSAAVRMPARDVVAVSMRRSTLGPIVVPDPFSTRNAGVELITFPGVILFCLLVNVVQSVDVMIPARIDVAVSIRRSTFGPSVVPAPFDTRNAGVELTTFPAVILFCLLLNVVQSDDVRMPARVAVAVSILI